MDIERERGHIDIHAIMIDLRLLNISLNFSIMLPVLREK